MDINTQLVVASIQQEVKKSLESCVGTVDLDSVKKELLKTLGNLQKRELIAPQFEIGTCSQLWSSWTLKQKLKWYFYNKTPIIRDLSDQIRKGIDDYNILAWDYKTEKYAEDPKEYPDYLIPFPKTIIVSNIYVKPTQGVEFIAIDFTLSDKCD